MTEELINFSRYPLNALNSPSGQALIEETRSSLTEDGSCTFPEFVNPDVLARMAAEAESIVHLAYPGPTEVTPYFFNYRLGEGEDLPADHPLLRKGKRNLAQIATDLIPGEFLLNRLYCNPVMNAFLTAVIEQPVYRSQDPYQSLNISVMQEGGCQQWHFDGGNMVTTLLLQEPEAGGVFEYAPMIRSEEDEHFDEVQAVLDDRSNRVRQLVLEAGMLSLFRGHYSLHRVTKVIGQRRRLQAILGYTTKAHYVGSRESSILHYGPRVAGIEARSPRYPD